MRAPANGRGERGQALIEVAFTTIILFILVLGIIDFGRAMFSYHAVSHAAQVGTRYALVRGKDSGILVTQAAVSAYVKSQMPIEDPADVMVTTTWQDGEKSGTWVRVQVDYNFHFVVPMASFMMTSTSQMVIAR